MSHKDRPPRRTFGLLNLEALEAREVPALNVWQGATDSFATAGYWSDGVPTSDDILVFTATPVSISRMGTVSGSNQSLTFPSTANLSYAGIRLLNSYAGTVTFPANISFGEYTQNSGTTAQASGTTLSVTGTFGWVGGQINASSGNSATYKLLGVANGQIGEDSTTLSLGSTLVLASGATAVQAGTVTLLNDADVHVKQDSELDQWRINVGGTGPKILGDGTIYLDSGRMYSDGGEVPAVKIEDGTLIVKQDGMKVTKKVAKTDWGVVMDGGVINIKNGSTLQVTEGVRVVSGDVLTTGAPSPTLQIATIDGKFRMLDGTIRLGTGNNTCYSTLIVTGLVELPPLLRKMTALLKEPAVLGAKATETRLV